MQTIAVSAVWVDGECAGELTLTVGLKLTSKSIFCSLSAVVDGTFAHRPGRPLDCTRMRTVEPSMQVTANFRCQVHRPLIIEPGQLVLVNCEHVTVTPVVAVMFATGPLETVVANFAAMVWHVLYARKKCQVKHRSVR